MLVIVCNVSDSGSRLAVSRGAVRAMAANTCFADRKPMCAAKEADDELDAGEMEVKTSPFLPSDRVIFARDAEMRITTQFPRIDWSEFVVDWSLADVKAIIHRKAFQFNTFYVGVSLGMAWRWSHCHGHNEDFIGHRYCFGYLFPLAFDRGMVICEEMVLEWICDTPELKSICENRWPYTAGPIPPEQALFLYLCIGTVFD
jgi:hypothetical protein